MEELPPEIEELLQHLTEREAEVLLSRFGLDRGEPRTVAEVAADFSETEDRIREIEAGAMQKLRARLDEAD